MCEAFVDEQQQGNEDQGQAQGQAVVAGVLVKTLNADQNVQRRQLDQQLGADGNQGRVQIQRRKVEQAGRRVQQPADGERQHRGLALAALPEQESDQGDDDQAVAGGASQCSPRVEKK
ncbi:hypothetical protein JOS77_25960 [Chromobacterium haemolyticum]|nr:hypothetical protein JOS77_25960 [Chromobacterium haemolyticum]